MNKMSTMALGAAIYLLTSPAFACDYPERPHIPDGATASKDELVAAKAGVQNYIAAVDAYLQCVEDEEKSAIAELENPAPDEIQRRDELLNKKFDAANEEKALVGEQFNQEIRTFNKKLKAAKEQSD